MEPRHPDTFLEPFTDPVERLLLTGAASIRDVLLFPQLRPEK